MARDVERQQLHASPRSSARSSQFEYVKQLRKVSSFILYARRRYCELSACVLGFSGVLLMLAQNELLMNTDTDTSSSSPTWGRETGLLALKWATTATTAILLGLLLVQYATRTEILKLQNAVPQATKCFVAQYPLILLELVLCGFHIPPECPTHASYDLVQQGDGCYLLYSYPVEALGVFMIVRLYLFARYLRSASSLYSQWVAFVGSLNEINAMRPFFHFKALFKIRPLLLLIPLTLLNTFFTAAIIRILEHPVQAAFANYWKAVWLAAVTMTATGFGDYYPVTYLGRAFTIISAMSGGILLIALVQSLFFGVLELSPRERKVKYLLDLDSWEQATQENAAQLIQSAWTLSRGGADCGHDSRVQHLYARMRRARRLRASKPEMALTLEEQIAELEHVVMNRMRHMEDEEAKLLERIQQKTLQVAKLKAILETTRSTHAK